MTTAPLSTLLDIGLTEPEAQIYLTLLEIGQAPASIVARKANLKRGHTYNLLEQLTKKGIATSVTHSKIQQFSVCAPADLANILERKKREIEDKKQRLLYALPALELLKNPHAHTPKVRFFEGEEGIKEMYEDTLKGKHKELYAFADFHYVVPQDKPRPLNDWIWEYSIRRAKKGIWFLGIVNNSPETAEAYRRRKEQKRKLRFTETPIAIPAEINIYGDKVTIYSEYEELVGVIIESHTIAETLRNLHQTLWKFLPSKPN